MAKAMVSIVENPVHGELTFAAKKPTFFLN
jgi:hypothetical protein